MTAKQRSWRQSLANGGWSARRCQPWAVTDQSTAWRSPGPVCAPSPGAPAAPVPHMGERGPARPDAGVSADTGAQRNSATGCLKIPAGPPDSQHRPGAAARVSPEPTALWQSCRSWRRWLACAGSDRRCAGASRQWRSAARQSPALEATGSGAGEGPRYWCPGDPRTNAHPQQPAGRQRWKERKWDGSVPNVVSSPLREHLKVVRSLETDVNTKCKHPDCLLYSWIKHQQLLNSTESTRLEMSNYTFLEQNFNLSHMYGSPFPPLNKK